MEAVPDGQLEMTPSSMETEGRKDVAGPSDMFPKCQPYSQLTQDNYEVEGILRECSRPVQNPEVHP